MDKKQFGNEPISASIPDAGEVLCFQSKRLITSLFKSHLKEIESIAEQHDIVMGKLIDALPVEYKNYVQLADFLTIENQNILRKRVLDAGNDCYRELEGIINNFNINYKQK